ncbi:MAG: hypothetical protein PGN33_14190 [Methylobacterium radiotolerans]
MSDDHDAITEAADALIAYGYKVQPVGDDHALWVVNGKVHTDSDLLALAVRLGLMDSTTTALQ